MTGEEYAIKKRRERQREYYRQHREQILAYQKAYNDKNREKVRARHTAYMREYRKRNYVKKVPSDKDE